MIENALPNLSDEIFLGRQTKLMIRVKKHAQGIWPVNVSSSHDGRLTPVSVSVNGANDLNYNGVVTAKVNICGRGARIQGEINRSSKHSRLR